MPLFLLANWRWLAPTAALVVVTLLLGLSRYQYTALKARVAQDEAATVALVNQLNQANRELENAQADFAMQLDKEHNDAVNALAGMHDAFAEQFTEQLRELKKCRSGHLPASAPYSLFNPGRAT